jgi:uncharacterized protein YdaU (DUF1376 family)
LGRVMHYYQFNIGDYQSHTSHLSEMEDLAFRRMLDWCYLHEKPLPSDIDEISRQIRMRSHSDCIASVLQEYFERTSDGWINARAIQEMLKIGEKSEKASASAKARWGKKDANALPTQSEGNATQDTRHNTQDTVLKSQRGSRLANDWVLPEDWKAWADKERPDLNAKQVAEQFKDFWCAKPGKDGVKLDWLATWRNWVRNQKAPKVNFADNIRTTVPASNEPDAALEKIKADERITRPPTLAELAKMAELRKAKA